MTLDKQTGQVQRVLFPSLSSYSPMIIGSWDNLITQEGDEGQECHFISARFRKSCFGPGSNPAIAWPGDLRQAYAWLLQTHTASTCREEKVPLSGEAALPALVGRWGRTCTAITRACVSPFISEVGLTASVPPHLCPEETSMTHRTVSELVCQWVSGSVLPPFWNPP